ncbi:hypothetical protein QQX85_04980, partial [Klebsiella variicola]|uniref:hypothetical protein n=1 Tax=Klebsiella variicola TaxID=244366 RepID=UPI00225AFD1B
KRAYCLKTQPATGETYPKSDLFNKAAAKVHQLHLVHSGILPDNTDKLLLQGIQQKNIAEVEISARGNDVTAVDFYYLPHSVNRFDDIEAILAACKR